MRRRVVLGSVACVLVALACFLVPPVASALDLPEGSCSETATVATPPANGTQILDVFTPAAGHYSTLESVDLRITTANAGSPRAISFTVYVAGTSGTDVLWRQDIGQAINVTSDYQFSRYNGGSAQTTNAIGLPDFPITPNMTFRIRITGVQAGDQWVRLNYVTCDGTTAVGTTPNVHVDNPQTAVTVSGAVTVGNTVDVSGSFTGTATSAICNVTTTTGPGDERISPCVQPVTLDESTSIPWLLIGVLVLLVVGFIFGTKLVRPR